MNNTDGIFYYYAVQPAFSDQSTIMRTFYTRQFTEHIFISFADVCTGWWLIFYGYYDHPVENKEEPFDI